MLEENLQVALLQDFPLYFYCDLVNLGAQPSSPLADLVVDLLLFILLDYLRQLLVGVGRMRYSAFEVVVQLVPW